MSNENGNSDNFSLLTNIYREVGETKVAVENVDSKIEKHIDFSLDEFKSINELDAEQNRILDKHIEGVNTLKEMHVAHRSETLEQITLLKESLELQKSESHKRIASLEAPYDLLKLIGKVLVWVVGVGTAAAITAWIKGWI